MKIIELSQRKDLLEVAVQYFWKCWGSEDNYLFYKNCIENALIASVPLPKFYIALEEETIIASYALLVNDIISRQDLLPWLACLHVNPEHRGKGLAGQLLEHALQEAYQKGFGKLYLSTDLEGFYEKKGWQYTAEAYGLGGDAIKIYSRSIP